MIDIYRASCANVKALKSQAKSLRRMFNTALINHRQSEINTLTKTYALLYSAYAEVSFLKLIHTPHGFDDDYISQIQKRKVILYDKDGSEKISFVERKLEDKWLTCIDFAFAPIRNEHNRGEIANKQQTIHRLLSTYIIEPSQIRNKIAHGQWRVCLNRDNTRVNEDTTKTLEKLDFVQIDRLFHVYDLFTQCIEDLIESPSKAHYRDFYSSLTNIEEYLDKTASYSIETKLSELESKQQRIKAKNQS